MTRRGDPQKIYQAQRYGIFRRLVDEERVNELDAEHWRPSKVLTASASVTARVADRVAWLADDARARAFETLADRPRAVEIMERRLLRSEHRCGSSGRSAAQGTVSGSDHGLSVEGSHALANCL